MKKIREDDILKDTYVVALTGYAGQQDLDLVAKTGFNLSYGKASKVIRSEIGARKYSAENSHQELIFAR